MLSYGPSFLLWFWSFVLADFLVDVASGRLTCRHPLSLCHDAVPVAYRTCLVVSGCMMCFDAIFFDHP
jgi:hypothetical protein